MITAFSRWTQWKPVVLGIAIVLGIAAECQQAKATEVETIVVAGGCFWCVESDFEKVPGVIEATSGYTGGTVADPSYKQVVRGGTGHLEAVKIEYDPSKVTQRELYDLFLRSIDPFDDGGQFCDRGPTYAPAIFTTAAQRGDAEAAVQAAEAELGQSIKVPVREAAQFFVAEDYHQDYYKSDTRILTRFGPSTMEKAYKRYRAACGRDDRVRQVWGNQAPFVGG